MIQPIPGRAKPTPAFGYVMLVDPEGNLSAEWVSNSYTQITGYRLEDLSDPAIVAKMVPEEDHPIMQEGLEALHRGEDWAGDHRLITPSGEVRWLRWFSHPEMDENGRLFRFEGSGHDVTELREVEADLRASGEALKLLDEAVWPIFWTTDLDLVVTTSTGAGLRLYGYEPGQNVGNHFYESVGSDDPDYPPNAATHRALKGERTVYEMEWRGHVFRSVIEPLTSEDGEIVGTAGVTVPKDVIAKNLDSNLARGVLQHMEVSGNGSDGSAWVEPIKVGDVTIDPLAFAAWKGSERLQLSPTEFRLLRQLASHPDEALSRESLLRDVWHHDFMGDSRLVDMAINRLRAKIENDPHNPELIQTVRGIGYRFETNSS